jgi:hypothetical protein
MSANASGGRVVLMPTRRRTPPWAFVHV